MMVMLSLCSSVAVNTQSFGIIKHARGTEPEVLAALVQGGMQVGMQRAATSDERIRSGLGGCLPSCRGAKPAPAPVGLHLKTQCCLSVVTLATAADVTKHCWR